jgi:hypothetical protein
MSVRSIFRASPLFLGLALAACGPDVNQAYTAPGWYLELPRQLFMAYPNYVAGPFSYEECEIERLKSPRPDRMLCTNWKVKPSET